MIKFSNNQRDVPSRIPGRAIMIAVTATVLLAAVTGFALWQTNRFPVNPDGFQIVKLSSGEIYIGKLGNPADKDYVVLNQVYTQTSAASSAEEDSDETQLQNSDELLLNRLSASVAKPEDTVYLSRDKIVYWANLQEDSKIVNAIKNDK